MALAKRSRSFSSLILRAFWITVLSVGKKSKLAAATALVVGTDATLILLDEVDDIIEALADD